MQKGGGAVPVIEGTAAGENFDQTLSGLVLIPGKVGRPKRKPFTHQNPLSAGKIAAKEHDQRFRRRLASVASVTSVTGVKPEN